MKRRINQRILRRFSDGVMVKATPDYISLELCVPPFNVDYARVSLVDINLYLHVGGPLR